MTSEKKLNNDNFISPYICELCNNNLCYLNTTYGFSKQGRIQDFKLGGGALKKIASSGGRRENFWCISCEKSRFYAKKSYFFQLRREARKLLGYFVWKIAILRKKNYIFSNFRGARAGAPPSGSAPAICYIILNTCKFVRRHIFVTVYLRPKTSSDKIRKKTLYWPGPVKILLYGPAH
jgi:hypothetical protein